MNDFAKAVAANIIADLATAAIIAAVGLLVGRLVVNRVPARKRGQRTRADEPMFAVTARGAAVALFASALLASIAGTGLGQRTVAVLHSQLNEQGETIAGLKKQIASRLLTDDQILGVAIQLKKLGAGAVKIVYDLGGEEFHLAGQFARAFRDSGWDVTGPVADDTFPFLNGVQIVAARRYTQNAALAAIFEGLGEVRVEQEGSRDTALLAGRDVLIGIGWR